MCESWRWFGPNDPVTINDIRQTGATDVVSALHTIPTGDVWSIEAIRQYQALIENCENDLMPLKWSVVESIPVHENIKTRSGNFQEYIDNADYQVVYSLFPYKKLKNSHIQGLT